MFRSTDCFLVLGTRGCGKSYLARRIQNIFPRKIIFDPLGEYSEGIFVDSFEEYSAKLIEFRKTKLNQFQLVFRFNPEVDSHDEIFNHAMRIAYYFGGVQITIEEVQLFSSPHKIPLWLKNNLLLGRHRNNSLVFTTQRPGELNKTILSQCNHIFAGQIHERNDLNYISSFLGINSDKLINIQKQYFLYFRPGEKIELVHNSLGAGRKQE